MNINRGLKREMYDFKRKLAEKNDVAELRLYVESHNSVARKTYESPGMNSEHYSFYEWMRK